MSSSTEIRKETTTEVTEEPGQVKKTIETVKTEVKSKETVVKETTTTTVETEED